MTSPKEYRQFAVECDKQAAETKDESFDKSCSRQRGCGSKPPFKPSG
jgi:hypothetical protein